MIFKAIFAQVRAPRAKMAEKCEKALINIIVIDMVIFKVIVKVKIIFKVMKKIVGDHPHSWTPCYRGILFTLLLLALILVC